MTIRPAAVAMKSNNRFNIANPEQKDEWRKRIAQYFSLKQLFFAPKKGLLRPKNQLLFKWVFICHISILGGSDPQR